jgi:hypothetical protein
MLSLLLPQAGQCFYNTSTGRWLSRDPISEKGGLNVYGYVMNQPTDAVDTLGLDWRSTLDDAAFGEGFLGGAFNWFFQGDNVHVPFSTYDPGWAPDDFRGFAGHIRSVCSACPARAPVGLSRVRDLFREGFTTILLKGGPGNITVRLRGFISSFNDSCPCRWRFRGEVTIAADPFDFDPQFPHSDRSAVGEAITIGVAGLQKATGIGHDFITYFDGSRSIDVSGACPGSSSIDSRPFQIP